MKAYKLKDILLDRKIYATKDDIYPHVTLSKEGIYDKNERYDRDFLVKDKDKKYKITKINDICYNPANLKFGVICLNEYGTAIFSPIYITFELREEMKEKINIKYLSYILTSKNFIEKVRKYEQGTVYERMAVGPKDFLNMKVKLPNKEEQDKIVKILKNVDCIINQYEKLLKEKDEFIRSQFVEMFGDLKINDKHWEKFDKLGNVCILNPKKSELISIDNMEISFIPMQAVSENGNIDLSETKLINDVKTGFTYFAENDVLFAKITPCMENGKGAVAKNLKNGIGFGSTEFHVIRPKKVINSIWLYTLTSLSSFRIEAQMHMTGSAGQKRVPIKFIDGYKIGIPPIELQNQFAEIVKQIDKQKLLLEQQKQNYINLKKGLMQQLLTGKVRVKI